MSELPADFARAASCGSLRKLELVCGHRFPRIRAEGLMVSRKAKEPIFWRVAVVMCIECAHAPEATFAKALMEHDQREPLQLDAVVVQGSEAAHQVAGNEG